MLIGNDQILKELKNFNDAIKSKRPPERNDLKALISEIGSFYRARKDYIADKKKMRVAAVDGSLFSYGGSYPYMLTCCQSYAYILPRENDDISFAKVFSPLINEDMERLRAEGEGEDGSALEMAAIRTAQKLMAELEMKAAMEAIDRYRPHLIMLDGGFVQYRIKTPALWEQFVKRVFDTDTLIVGVIEEVSTHMISEVLGNKLPGQPYDREIFYGNLDMGQWFLVHPDYCTKEGFITAFARLSKQPQVIACDFLFEQWDYVHEVMDIVYSMTPEHSRGIPVLLDLVDRAVRLTAPEIKRLIEISLDPMSKELLLRAQRDRRLF